jgi:hypothetical protein
MSLLGYFVLAFDTQTRNSLILKQLRTFLEYKKKRYINYCVVIAYLSIIVWYTT